MKILVTGATGLIGKRVCGSLADEGHEIVVLSRRPERARMVPEARSFRWDPEEGAPPGEVWDGIEAVIHLAGEPVAGVRWSEGQKRRIRDSRVIGTRNLVDGIKTARTAGVAGEAGIRPKILVSGSAVGYYGDRGDEQLFESSGPGKGFLSDVCVEWENESSRAQGLGLRVVIVRTGIVLSDSGGALEKMLTPFKLGLGGRLASGKQWFPWIHLDDIVGIFRHGLLSTSLNGPINGAAPGIVSNEEFTKELAAALERPVFFPVPELGLRILMGEMADVVLASQRVIPGVAIDSGYKFKYQMLGPALRNLKL